MTQCKTIAVDLAKDVYEIGFANRAHRIVQRKRLNRAAFRKLLATEPTAVVAAAGSSHHFRSGRHFASWLGLTPRESSSGNRRYLGKISKKGDTYLRTLLIHGARSVLIHARRRHKEGQPLTRLQRWAVELHGRVGHNKAAVGLANKLARICWATWKHQRNYDADYALRFVA